jgi:hypothetical protein
MIIQRIIAHHYLESETGSHLTKGLCCLVRQQAPHWPENIQGPLRNGARQNRADGFSALAYLHTQGLGLNVRFWRNADIGRTGNE